MKESLIAASGRMIARLITSVVDGLGVGIGLWIALKIWERVG